MLNEDLIEMAFIDQLTGQDFEFHHGPDIAPDSDNPQRKNFDSVVLENELLKAIKRLNPGVPSSAINEAQHKSSMRNGRKHPYDEPPYKLGTIH